MELREKIANVKLYPMLQKLGVVVDCKLSGFKIQEILLETADQILALVKESGYVKLAENQELPENPFSCKAENFSLVRHNAYEDGQATMVNSGWRKLDI